MDYIELLKIFAAILALIVAIVGHEIMHGLVASLYGDMTAKNAGRLSINPIVHIDLVGTILVPSSLYFIPMFLGADNGLLFGWAKPVPINMRQVIHRGGYNAAMQVDLAGIFYNFTLGIIASIVLVYMDKPTLSDSIFYIFTYLFIFKLIVINILLAIFNLIPIPSFDGAHFIANLSQKYGINAIAKILYKYEKYAIIFVFILFMTPLKDFILLAPFQTIMQLLIKGT